MRRARPLLVLSLVVAALGASPAAARAAAFSSPSGNIGCFIDRAFVRCDIRHKDWDVPRPKGCELDFGQGLTVSRRARRGRVVCAGDTALTGAHPLAYGKRIRRGGNRCTSRVSGMRCTNRRGHGFFLSRQRFKRF